MDAITGAAEPENPAADVEPADIESYGDSNSKNGSTECERHRSLTDINAPNFIISLLMDGPLQLQEPLSQRTSSAHAAGRPGACPASYPNFGATMHTARPHVGRVRVGE